VGAILNSLELDSTPVLVEEFGTEELEDVIDLAAVVVKEAFEFGEFSWIKLLPVAFSSMGEIKDALDGASQILPEVLNLSFTEKRNLVDRFIDKLDLENDEHEEFAEAVVDWLLGSIRLYVTFPKAD